MNLHPAMLLAADDGKNASWFLGLFGVETKVTNFLIFCGIGIVVIGVLGIAITVGFLGEQGKQKAKKKLPWIIGGAFLCFVFLPIVDVIVSTLRSSGDNVQKDKMDQIFGDSAPADAGDPVAVDAA